MTHFPPDVFYGTSGPCDARIMVVGEAWGEMEERHHKPFVGSSGQVLDTGLGKAGIRRENCLVTNLIPRRPLNNEMTHFFYTNAEAKAGKLTPYKGLYPKPILQEGLKRLNEQILRVQPDLIIGCGNYPMWAITDGLVNIKSQGGVKVPTGIGHWRGSQIRLPNGTGFLPVVHPAATFRKQSLRHLLYHDLRKRTGEWEEPNYQFTIAPRFQQVKERLEYLTNRASTLTLPLAVDLETALNRITCCGLAWSKTSAISIPFLVYEQDGDELRLVPYWSAEEEHAIVTALRKLLLYPKVQVIGHNFLYDIQYLFHWWLCAPEIHYDTIMMQHLCWPGTPRALYYISSLYRKHHVYWKDEGKKWFPGMDPRQQWRYNCLDAVATFECCEVLQDLMRQQKVAHLYEAERRPTQRIAFEMMVEGITRDEGARKQMIGEVMVLIAEREEWLAAVMPSSVWLPQSTPWYRSPTQIMSILYDRLALPEQRDPKTKKRTSNIAALRTLAVKEPILRPVVQNLEELRSLYVILSTFLLSETDDDGRFRCLFDPAKAETYRWTSEENAWGRGGNMQNQPEGVSTPTAYTWG